MSKPDEMTPAEGDEEPRRADLMPATISYRCPVCNHTHECDDLEEDDAGEHRVPSCERFRNCEDCGALLDIGWAGWGWHDGSATAANGAAGQGREVGNE